MVNIFSQGMIFSFCFSTLHIESGQPTIFKNSFQLKNFLDLNFCLFLLHSYNLKKVEVIEEENDLPADATAGPSNENA